MAIREIRRNEFDQECARCGGRRTLAFSSVEVGLARGNHVDARVIPLPACPTCGATEFLLRSPDDEEHPSQGSYGHLHRLLVDLLHARLVKANRVTSGLDGKTVPLREPPAEVLGRWFKNGLRLPRPELTDGGTK